MSGAARIGDSVAEGQITTGSSDVFVDGIPVARIGDSVSPHGTGEHADAVIATGSATVFVNGIPVARNGDTATCGDTINSASSDVLIGG